jgi:predicted small lipoprotein YifL
MSKTARAAMMLLLALLLQGCGRKGPLFMLPPPVPASSAPAEQKPANPVQAAPNQPETKK